jgi:plastocyanin
MAAGTRRAASMALLALVACAGDAPRPGESDSAEGDEATPLEGVWGLAPPAAGTIPSVVELTPVDPALTAAAPRPQRARPRIDQFGLAFSPTLLLVDADTRVVFTNSEGALAHNVHLVRVGTGETIFDEDANSGDVLTVRLAEAGGYDVLCDMHPGMSAFIFVTDETYAVMADADGAFSFPSLPAGAYEARLWTSDGGFHDPVPVTVPATGAVHLELEASR